MKIFTGDINSAIEEMDKIERIFPTLGTYNEILRYSMAYKTLNKYVSKLNNDFQRNELIYNFSQCCILYCNYTNEESETVENIYKNKKSYQDFLSTNIKIYDETCKEVFPKIKSLQIKDFSIEEMNDIIKSYLTEENKDMLDIYLELIDKKKLFNYSSADYLSGEYIFTPDNLGIIMIEDKKIISSSPMITLVHEIAHAYDFKNEGVNRDNNIYNEIIPTIYERDFIRYLDDNNICEKTGEMIKFICKTSINIEKCNEILENRKFLSNLYGEDRSDLYINMKYGYSELLASILSTTNQKDEFINNFISNRQDFNSVSFFDKLNNFDSDKIGKCLRKEIKGLVK